MAVEIGFSVLICLIMRSFQKPGPRSSGSAARTSAFTRS
jgi:hypothetical protein